MSTQRKPRALSAAQQRELARQLGGILERLYAGELEAEGPVALGIARRMEGAKAMLDLTLEPEPPPQKTRRRR